MSKKFLSPIRLAQGATNPAVGSEGELFWNTTDLKVYIHNGTSWAASGGAFTMSPTAPTSPEPKHGDPWFDTSDGSLYVRYVDVDNTGQWVQVQTNSAINSELANRAQALETDVAVLQTQTSGFEADVISLDSRTDSLEARTTAIEASYNSPNYILNGGMEINQRALPSTATYKYDTYLTDRWKTTDEVDASVQDVASVGVPCYKALRMGSRSSEGTKLRVFQKLESSEAKKLRSKTVTVSFYIRFSAATFSPQYNVPTGFFYGIQQNTTTTDSVAQVDSSDINNSTSIPNGSLPTSWTRVSYTTTLSALMNNLTVYGQFDTWTSAPNSSFWYEITGVQLEEGSVATKFRRNASSIQAELAACQRYYYRWTADNTYAWVGIATGNGSNAWMPIAFPVTMRAVPSTTPEWSGSFSAMNFLLGGTPTSFVYAGDGMNKYCATLTFSGSGFASSTIVRSANTTSLYFGFSAEL